MSPRKLRALVVCSVGGHLAEAMELEPVLADCDLALVVNDEAPWRRGFERARSYRIVHAERDARLFINLVEAARILYRERPDVVISTGASPAVPFFLLARLFGMETIYIECFGNVETPSLTGRLVAPICGNFFSQWPELLSRIKNARYVGPLFPPCPHPEADKVSKTPPLKLLVTVGSSDRPFRRLFSWLDTLEEKGVLPAPRIVQSAAPNFAPRRVEITPFLPGHELEHHVRTADKIICHAGSGIMGACLKWSRHAIVVPRRAAEGEAINDHQMMLARALFARGLATICESERELEAAIKKGTAVAASAKNDLPRDLLPAVAEILRRTAEKRGLS